jgi:putative SOS response-associated peptidase YedK
MCNNYEQHIAWRAYCEMTRALEWGIPARQSEADLPQADDIRITDLAPVMRAAGEEIELAPMTFGFPPATPRGGPIFNSRSERRSFAKSTRCLIPASEFAGTKSPKTKQRFALNDAPFMAIFAMLTMAPGPDVAPIHNRQVAVLRPHDWKAWIYRKNQRPKYCGCFQRARCTSKRRGSGAAKRALGRQRPLPNHHHGLSKGAKGPRCAGWWLRKLRVRHAARAVTSVYD